MLVSHYDRGPTQILSDPIKKENAISKAIMATRGRRDQFEMKKKTRADLIHFCFL